MSDTTDEFFSVARHLFNCSKLGRLALLSYIASQGFKDHERWSRSQCTEILEKYAVEFFVNRPKWESDFQCFVGIVTGAINSAIFGDLRSRMWPVGHHAHKSIEELLPFARESLETATLRYPNNANLEEPFAEQVRRCVIELIQLTVQKPHAV